MYGCTHINISCLSQIFHLVSEYSSIHLLSPFKNWFKYIAFYITFYLYANICTSRTRKTFFFCCIVNVILRVVNCKHDLQSSLFHLNVCDPLLDIAQNNNTTANGCLTPQANVSALLYYFLGLGS